MPRKKKQVSASRFDDYDGIDEIYHDDIERAAFGSANKRLNRRSYRKKRTSRRLPSGGEGESDANRKDILEIFYDLLLSKRARRVGVPMFCVALLTSMLIELHANIPQYNTSLILALAASIELKHIPAKVVRPQLVLSLCTMLSFALDVYLQVVNPLLFTATLTTAFVFLMLSKALFLFAFLRSVQSASRTRKYLNRRSRLFYPPLYQPRRINRDIRGRMLVIGWVQVGSTFAYIILFLVLVLSLDYSVLRLDPSTDDSTLPFFLAVKAASSAFILCGVLYDTDLVLCLWYFGCLGFNIEYVRSYIRRKRIKLKGWPLPFSFSDLRFHILAFFKLADILWGVYGWTIIGVTFGSRFTTLESHLKIFFAAVALALTASDIYCAVLFFGVRWLLRRLRLVRDIGMLEDSDDSEIEEFGLRTDLEIERRRAEAAEERRLAYQLKIKEEELLARERARKKEEEQQQRRQTDGSIGVVSSILQSWWDEGITLNKGNNAVHPFSDPAGDPTDAAGEGERWMMFAGETSSGLHALRFQLQQHPALVAASESKTDKYGVLWNHLMLSHIDKQQQGAGEEDGGQDAKQGAPAKAAGESVVRPAEYSYDRKSGTGEGERKEKRKGEDDVGQGQGVVAAMGMVLDKGLGINSSNNSRGSSNNSGDNNSDIYSSNSGGGGNGNDNSNRYHLGRRGGRDNNPAGIRYDLSSNRPMERGSKAPAVDPHALLLAARAALGQNPAARAGEGGVGRGGVRVRLPTVGPGRGIKGRNMPLEQHPPYPMYTQHQQYQHQQYQYLDAPSKVNQYAMHGDDDDDAYMKPFTVYDFNKVDRTTPTSSLSAPSNIRSNHRQYRQVYDRYCGEEEEEDAAYDAGNENGAREEESMSLLSTPSSSLQGTQLLARNRRRGRGHSVGRSGGFGGRHDLTHSITQSPLHGSYGGGTGGGGRGGGNRSSSMLRSGLDVDPVTFATKWDLLRSKSTDLTARVTVRNTSDVELIQQRYLQQQRGGGSQRVEGGFSGAAVVGEVGTARSLMLALKDCVVAQVISVGFLVVAAGVSQDGVLKVYCCGAFDKSIYGSGKGGPGAKKGRGEGGIGAGVKGGVEGSDDDESSMVVGLLEIKLHLQQSSSSSNKVEHGGANCDFVLQCGCRTEIEHLGQLFLKQLQLHGIFYFM